MLPKRWYNTLFYRTGGPRVRINTTPKGNVFSLLESLLAVAQHGAALSMPAPTPKAYSKTDAVIVTDLE